MQGIAACRFTLIIECSYSGENGAIDERTCLEWVLSFYPVGVIEGKQFDLPPQCALFRVADLWGSVHDRTRIFAPDEQEHRGIPMSRGGW